METAEEILKKHYEKGSYIPFNLVKHKLKFASDAMEEYASLKGCYHEWQEHGKGHAKTLIKCQRCGQLELER